MSIGACAPRSASACIRSSEVGSAQCRSSNASATGCERAPARNHAISAASCLRRDLPARQIGGAARRRRDVDKRRNERRMFGRVETDQLQCVLEVGEALARQAFGAAETLAAPFGDRVQRRILQ